MTDSNAAVRMPRFLILIYGDERMWAEGSQQWQDENVAGHVAFNAANGVAVLAGGELARSATAVSVRADSAGRPQPNAGPFVQTAANIGGFYLIEAPNLEEAVRIASQLPEASTPSSGVEIRAVADSS